MHKLIENNIKKIVCEVNGDEYDGLSFEFLFYNNKDEFSFKEQYSEDDVVNVEKTLGVMLYGTIASRLVRKKCLHYINTKTSGADFVINDVGGRA